MKNNMPIIGILGGAGPDATIDLQIELSKAMKLNLGAVTDQDHIRVITDNFTSMPDRSLALEANGRSPIDHMIASAKCLERLGCDILLYPCNTAHAYLSDIQESINIPLLDMINLTCDKIRENIKPMEKVGILCTDMTKKIGLYENSGINFIYPEKIYQQGVMQAIFATKAGFTKDLIQTNSIKKRLIDYLVSINALENNKNHFSQSASTMVSGAIDNLRNLGANKIVLGCTEIPLCIDNSHITNKDSIEVYNPTRILAHAAVQYMQNKLQAAEVL